MVIPLINEKVVLLGGKAMGLVSDKNIEKTTKIVLTFFFFGAILIQANYELFEKFVQFRRF